MNLIQMILSAAAARLATTTGQMPDWRFDGQHTNPARNLERKRLREIGRRQYRKENHK